MNKWCEKEIAEMIESVADCAGPADVCGLFDIILTPREINDMARRNKIIQMLESGKSYSDIKDELGVGGDVIARVAGKIGFGFRRVHATVAKRSAPNQWKDPLTRKRDIYYKGVPSPGTMLRHLKK